MFGQPFEIVNVSRRDHCATSKVRDRNAERIDCQLRSSARVAKELSSSHTNARVNRANFYSIAPQAREHGGVGAPAPNDFGQNRCNRRDGMTQAPGFDEQRPNALSSCCRPVRENR